MITLGGQILVSRIGDDPPLRPRVSIPKRFPCLRSKRFRVYWHQAHMFPTCGLGAGTHGDVLNLHTESVLNVCTVFFFTFFHRAATHTNTHTHQHTHHDHNDTTTTQHQHGDRNRERKRDKTRRQDKRREKMKEKREFDSTQEKLTRAHS